MIIIRFGGGLGNQMLQYASYLALQLRYPDTKVVADTRNFNTAKMHNGLELERIFPIELNIFFGKKKNEVNRFERYWHYAVDKASLFFFKAGFKKYKFIEDNGTFNEELFQLNPAITYYLIGQWGNEKYFENVKINVLKNFSFKVPLDPINEKRSTKIISTNSISVHIRRGDYIGNLSEFVDLCKGSYYPKAFSLFGEMTENPVFYIFSDDARWCTENLLWLKEYSHCFVTENNGKDSYKDMQLMSLCKHNIIANSTFSWWGAVLNKSDTKKVICPGKIFKNDQKNEKIVSEFYPASWIKL